MSDAYAGKSDQVIIAEQAASLNSKENYQTNDRFQSRNTVTAEQSGVNEDGVEGFPGAQVSVGRSGMSGGGTNPQNIPPEEGGLERSQVQGESSARFEGLGGPEDKKYEVSDREEEELEDDGALGADLGAACCVQTLANNPGSFDADPRGIDQPWDRSKKEAIPIKQGQELQPGQGIVADQAGQGSRADIN